MKKISVREFQKMCKNLKLKGKCSVLLGGSISFIRLKSDDIIFDDMNYSNTNALLVNFKVSPKFEFSKFIIITQELLKNTPNDLDVVLTVTYDNKSKIDIASITMLQSNKNIISKMFNLIKSKLACMKYCIRLCNDTK